MKREYIKPMIEIERYEMNTSIAANCTNVVSQGPAVGDHTACKEYEDIWGDEFSISLYEIQGAFYNDGTCTCYYSSSSDGTFTS